MREVWKYKPLSDVCDILNGFAFQSKNYVDQGIRVIRIANVQKGYIEDQLPAYYPAEAESELSRYMLKDGDLLMSLTGNVGRVGILNKEMLPAALNQRVACVRIKSKEVYLKYLFHYFNSDLFEKKCIASSHGAAQLNMSTVWLSNYSIPLPSLSEQQRIVDFLDAEFEKIDQLKANADAQLQAAKDLFQAALKQLLTPKEGWELGCLGDIASVIHGKNQKEVVDENGQYPIYGSGGNIMGYANDFTCEEGTTILGRKGTIDNPLYIDTRFWNVDTAFGIFPKPGNDKKFLFYTIKAEDWRKRNTGTTLPSLTQSVVLSVPINYPPLPEQQQIAQQLDAISEKVQLLQQNYDKTITLCNDLKQALLKSIFA